MTTRHNTLFLRRLQCRPGWKARNRLPLVKQVGQRDLPRNADQRLTPRELIAFFDYVLRPLDHALWLRLHAVTYGNARRFPRVPGGELSDCGRRETGLV